jgi:hypothetical protein
MNKLLSWPGFSALGLIVVAACNGGLVPVGQDTPDAGSHTGTGCTGTSPTCPAYCDGTVSAGPGECLDGTWTCIAPSCPAPSDGGPSVPDASSGCPGTAPTCPDPCGTDAGSPAVCLSETWTCGDICAGVKDGG